MDELEKLKEEVFYWKDQYHLQKDRAEYVIRATETPAEERYNIALQATLLAAKQRQEALIEVLELREEVERLKSGKFTEEELQNLCHTFCADDIRSFMFGCLDYQCHLFERDRVKKELSRQLLNAIQRVAWALNIQSYADALAEGLIYLHELEKNRENTNSTP